MSAKRVARHWIDHIARLTGVLGRCRAAAARGGVALMYHRVLPDDQAGRYPLDGLVVPESLFACQVAWLAHHAEIVTLAELDSRRREGRPSDPPAVSLTFDDGFADNAEVAAPVLDAYGVPGVFFVATGFVESRRPLWFDLAAMRWSQSGADQRTEALGDPTPETLGAWMACLKRLKPGRRNRVLAGLDEICGPLDYDAELYRPMTPEQVGALRDRGHEIGAHTETHPIMTGLSDEELEQEVDASKQAIDAWTGQVPTSFCYPNGDADERVAAAVRSAGFERATVTDPGVSGRSTDAFRLPRMNIQPARVTTPGGEHSDLAFAAEVWGLHSRLRERGRWQGAG